MNAKKEAITHEWTLEGLDCANCAIKIEDGVGKIEGVQSCSVNFVTKTLTMDIGTERASEIISQARHKVKRLDPHVHMIEKPRHGHVKQHAHDHNGHTDNSEGDGSHAGHQHAASAEEHDHSHEGHSHAGHTHDHGAAGTRRVIVRLIIGGLVAGAAWMIPADSRIQLLLYLAAYLVIGADVVLQAVRSLLRGFAFDEYFLMTLATVGALAIGQYPEAVAVMFFYQIGEMFQGLAVNRSRKSISALMDIRPDYANLKTEGSTQRVSPEEIRVGDHIIVRPGEKVPLDGKVLEGTSMVNTSALTGESVPRSVEPGSSILSGFINTNGVLTVEVTATFGESTVSKILELVQNASNKKAPTEKFITKFSKYYTPVVVGVALLLAVVPPLVLPDALFADWLYRALIFLVISCPCALVVSIPLGFFGGIGAASKAGVLIKGGNYLEALNDVTYAVFDKTGTLTKGVFRVTDIQPAEGITSEELLEAAALAEIHSTHPIADSIRNSYGQPLAEDRIQQYNDIAGHGIQAVIDNREVLVGNAKLMSQEHISINTSSGSGSSMLAAATVVHVAIDRTYAGCIFISDEVKDDAARTIASLKKLGIKKTIMLTGDNQLVADTVGRTLGIDEVYAELLPQHKVEQLEKLAAHKQAKEKILFVGDGINDTPVLAQADIGAAMGGLGSDAAIEAADIVVMTDEPYKLVTAVQIAKRTRKVVWQNIIFALGVKAAFLLLGAFGFATMWEAVFSDVGVTLLAVLNVLRVLRVPADK